MVAACSLVFKQLELEYNKPVGMGIIGPGATAEQAEGRVAYAGNATRASIRMARFMAAQARVIDRPTRFSSPASKGGGGEMRKNPPEETFAPAVVDRL